MKKLITFLTLLALLAIPVSAMAVKAADWELVGYVKLETYWDSAQANKNLSGPLLRSNTAQPQQYGRLRFTSQSSRFGFRVNGPEILGAKTQGYIEIDFDPAQDARQTASHSLQLRVRHAWFRMDWPGGWQLLMGQYWGVFCDFYPETVNDGPYQNHGQATQRIPQIRLTYKTNAGKGPWTFSALVGAQYDPAGDNQTFAFGNLIGSQAASNIGAFWGQNAIWPQFHAQVIFEKDLYGKAAYAGAPRGFVADFGFGIQSTKYPGGRITGAQTWGNTSFGPFQQNGYLAIDPGPARALVQGQTQTLTPWVIQGTLFIPVLVTHTANLANTASITIQAHIGEGFSFWGNGTDANNSFFVYDAPGWQSGLTGVNGVNAGVGFVQNLNYRRRLVPKYGGYIQGQYYFTNQWFVSVVYGFDKAYRIPQEKNFGINPGGPFGTFATSQNPLNIENYVFATTNDLCIMNQEIQANLFWRPHKNLKFGLGYSYLESTYLQTTRNVPGTGGVGSQESRTGRNHSIRFGGWFFF